MLSPGMATCPHFTHTKRPYLVALMSLKASLKTQYGQRALGQWLAPVGLSRDLLLLLAC